MDISIYIMFLRLKDLFILKELHREGDTEGWIFYLLVWSKGSDNQVPGALSSSHRLVDRGPNTWAIGCFPQSICNELDWNWSS